MKKQSFIPLISIFIISPIISSCSENSEPMVIEESRSSIFSGNTSSTGTISKTMSYETPSGNISTIFILDIDESGTIKTIKATAVSRNHEDIYYHNRFNNVAKSKIVGKKLSELSSITTIGGGSLTTEAFKKTITSI